MFVYMYENMYVYIVCMKRIFIKKITEWMYLLYNICMYL